jgi:membrane dipeptidase
MTPRGGEPGWTRREVLGWGALATAQLALPLGCGAHREISDAARALHRESAVFDLHVDTLLWTRLFGYDLGLEHRNRIPLSPFGFHMDLPRAREGGLDGAVMGLVINPEEVRDELMLPLRVLAGWEDERGVSQVAATLALLDDAATRYPTELSFCHSGSELREAIAGERFAALAGLEGGQGLSGDLANVAVLHARGLRMLGLVHFQATEAGYPMTVSRFEDLGLTPFGFELLDELGRLDMVVDLAHLNERGVADALAHMRGPCVVSHSACRALVPHPRNLSDDALRAIANEGGVIGIAAGRSFLGLRADMDALLDHVEHAVEVAGPGAVALGSDYDGFITPASGLGDVRSYPLVTDGLLRRGMPEATIRGVLGENALRVVSEVCG